MTSEILVKDTNWQRIDKIIAKIIRQYKKSKSL